MQIPSLVNHVAALPTVKEWELPEIVPVVCVSFPLAEKVLCGESP